MSKRYDGTKNLIPMDQRTEEEQKEITRKGGIASGESRRRRRDFKQTLEILSAMKIDTGRLTDIAKVQSAPELKGKNLTVLETIAFTVIRNAQKGDMASIRLLIEMLGEKPAQKLEVEANVKDEGKLEGILEQMKKWEKGNEK